MVTSPPHLHETSEKKDASRIYWAATLLGFISRSGIAETGVKGGRAGGEQAVMG